MKKGDFYLFRIKAKQQKSEMKQMQNGAKWGETKKCGKPSDAKITYFVRKFEAIKRLFLLKQKLFFSFWGKMWSENDEK